MNAIGRWAGHEGTLFSYKHVLSSEGRDCWFSLLIAELLLLSPAQLWFALRWCRPLNGPAFFTLSALNISVLAES